ncbi:hypothetical protein ACT3XE_19305 [Halomonas sp. AOP7-C1-8]|uniref:hypothetical protein n=1 Tax=unclassified Halomonas TaxID=2609666 RepID=UPI004028A484
MRIKTKVVETARGFGLKSAMQFGTQHGHYPLPDKSQIDADWRRVEPKCDVFISQTAEETARFLVMSPGLMRLRQIPLVKEPQRLWWPLPHTKCKSAMRSGLLRATQKRATMPTLPVGLGQGPQSFWRRPHD